jgi:putative tricarboxylic transport membrane protein
MRSDRILGPVICALSLTWLLLVYQYIPASTMPEEPGPRAFPVMLGMALFLLGAAMAVTAWGSQAGSAPAEPGAASPLRHELRTVFGTFGLLILYAFLLEKTGFLVSTPIVLVLAMAGILRMRRWKFIGLMSVGTTVVCWTIFALLLRVPLPRGSLWWLL